MVGEIDVAVYLYKDLFIVSVEGVVIVVVPLWEDLCDALVVCDGLIFGELLVRLC